MVAETAKKFEALERQAQILMKVFVEAGYEAVAPAIIQPAGVFLDVIGEALRARTYVFSDPDGDELCLRPDLTVPTCRLHLARGGNQAAATKYCYNGIAFRFQPQGSSKAHPSEFRQAGIETFGDTNPSQSEAETLATIISAVQSAGVEDFKLRIGDLGLFRDLLVAADMPERWRQRLMHQFWRPDAFRTELKRLSGQEPVGLSNLPEDLVSSLKASEDGGADELVLRYFSNNDIEIIGTRSVSEITANLMAMIEDASADPLPQETVALIEGYLGVNAPARAAGARLRDLTRSMDVDLSEALDTYHERLDILTSAGVDIVHAEFSAEFGRTLEYYTGFVFELMAPSLGPKSPIAGGGRYDNVLRAAGAETDIPAVGAAIHTERLLTLAGADKPS